MKLNIHTATQNYDSNGYCRNNYNQHGFLKIAKTIEVGSITITILEHKYAYYIGFLKGKEFYSVGSFLKENFYNETPQQILDNLTKRIENLKVGDVLVYFTERFQELNGENLTTNQEAKND